MSKVQLVIAGLAYSGWEQIRIQLGMEQLAGTFTLTLIDRWPGQREPRPIRAGQSCRVLIDGAVVITGYVDEVDAEVESDAHSITVCGRDVTGDLVDCSVVQTRTRSGQWRNRTLLQIASDVCAPFKIPVVSEVTLSPIRSANVQEGETAYELLDRLAKLEGVLLLTNGQGQLVIAQPGRTHVPTVLREGVNLLSARSIHSWRERFSHYVVKGQRPATEDDDGAAPAHVSASQRDPEIDRYRPLVVIADEHGGSPARHAAWEAHVRNGRGTRAAASVPGWTHAGGLWRPNTRVHLVAPMLQTDDELMVASVTFSLDNTRGFVTELELADPAAFDVEAGLRASPIGRKARGKNGLSRAVARERKPQLEENE